MANPTRDLLQIVGQPVRFVNSTDMRLIIDSDAPTIDIAQPVGFSSPKLGSMSFGSTAPTVFATGAVKPAKGGINLDGHGGDGGAYLTGQVPVGGWGVGMLIQGLAPSLAGALTKSPTKGALVLTEQDAQRGIGLYIQSEAPTVSELKIVSPNPDTLAIGSESPDVFQEPPIFRVPPKRALNISGKAPGIAFEQDAGAPDSLNITGNAPAAIVAAYLPEGLLVLAGKQPSAQVSANPPPIVIIQPGANEGTVIRNRNAVTGLGTRYEICDISGRKVKRGQLVRQWDGLWVHPDMYTARHPQSMPLEKKAERLEGSPRPEHEDKFIGEDIPAVTVDDL